MWPLIRATIGGIAGYLIAAWLTLVARGGTPSDDVVVTFGFIGGLIGWLLGIGIWNTWVREWRGMPAKDEHGAGWRRYFRFTPDHKVIGIQYLVTMIGVLFLGGFAAMIMRIELASAGQDILNPDQFALQTGFP